MDKENKCATYTQWSVTQLWKNDFMKFTGKLMKLYKIFLSEVTQIQWTNMLIIHLYVDINS